MTSGVPSSGAKKGQEPRCPTCRKPARPDAGMPSYLPFCSERCQLVDLGRWFDGAYSVPGEAAIDMDGFALPDDRGAGADWDAGEPDAF